MRIETHIRKGLSIIGMPMFKELKIRPLFTHIIFWILFTAVFTIIEGGYQNEFKQAFFIELAYLPIRLVVIYFNFFYLLPKFLTQGKNNSYLWWTIFSLIVAAFIQRFLIGSYYGYYIFPDWDNSGNYSLFSLLQTTVVIAFPLIFVIGFTVTTKWVSLLKKTESLEREKKQAELELLKSQLNPHFFFNTLNSLYSLAQEKSEKTEQVVLKLSDLMNYMLYETEYDFVPLEKEIDYIRSYIELEEIRYGSRFTCNFSLEGSTKDINVPPMILLPFIENAFKHGVNQESENAWITIFLSITDGVLEFKLENSLAKFVTSKKSKRESNGGIGILNVKKRLELLYLNKHELVCTKKDDSYSIALTINLNTED